MEPKLDFNDKSLKSYFLNSHLCMLIVDSDFKSALEINQSGEKLFGFEREIFLTKSLQSLFKEGEPKKLEALRLKTTKEVSFYTNSGKTVYAEAAVSAIMFEDKEAWLITLTDITEKKMYRQMLEESIDEELSLKARNKELKDLAYMNFHLVRKPLANILGLVNVLDGSVTSDKTLGEVLAFLKESGNELDGLIKNLDPQQY
jgi:PAS domain S-box-containing protein